jgi:prepilin-type N-terminal cleavage/methylation domain-containing protein
VRSRGFTLVEVMVAVVVIGVVLIGARALLGQVADGVDRIVAVGGETDREANAGRMLRAVVGRVEVDASPENRRLFHGQPAGARFHSWCEVAEGWLERCAVSLGFVELDGGRALALRTGAAEPLALRRGFAAGELRYLRDAADGGEWIERWGASISPPLAVGVIVDGDTTILRIGERG